ncbi:hypothetical protein EST38_g6900 [Candolleomyces aberdarensis]|uniref:Nephrocystin 3-like N-terminal domain-containing protein n=1 Tax=Candolleomyces aberdarensis TaxID=2316362 RepID=A0A4Q2DGQ5_9AGAR|nr:hypothetical protein EST38_g6900 [Candolleomyces aberdarensis]
MSSVSYFKNAKNFVVNNPTFNTYVTGADALQFLYEHSATGAMHDSDERYPPPVCHPGTRQAVIVRIADWYGYRTGPGMPIMWVHAPAGYGKTAIAGTVSKMLEEIVGLSFSPLGATFFFWRTSPERNSPSRFIITIAYQLAVSIPELAPHIEIAVKRNPMILRKTLEVQMFKLIVEPFKAIGRLEGIPNRLVIIDGLDECINSEQESRVEKKYAEDQEKVQIRVLKLIHILQSHHLPLSFLILSRPEPWIEKHISAWRSEDAVEVVDLYEIGDHMNDVEKYIRAELTRISSSIEPQVVEEWPTENIVRVFVWKTNGHMLYASTALQHIDDPYDDPRKRLKDILDSSPNSHPDLEHSTTFSSLFELYRQILRSCPASQRSVLVEVLEDIIVASIDKHFNVNAGLRRALATLDSVSGRAPGCGVRAIRGLHAVLRLSNTTTNTTNAAWYTGWLNPFIHSSFVEFLTNPMLSLEFAVDTGRARRRLLRNCIECISVITSQTEVEEDHLQYALLAFRPLWIKTWWNEEELRREAEYLEMVKRLLTVDLTTCFIKVFTRRETCLTPTYMNCRLGVPHRAPKPIGPAKLHFSKDLVPLVERAFFHVQSSMEGALLSLLDQFRHNRISGYWWSPEFTDGLELYLFSLCDRTANSNQWKSDKIVKALKNLRHERKENCFFDQLIREVEGYLAMSWPSPMQPVLNFISCDDS